MQCCTSQPSTAGTAAHQMVRPMSSLTCVPEERCFPRFRTAAAGSPPACVRRPLCTSPDGCQTHHWAAHVLLSIPAAAQSLASTCWAACQAPAALLHLARLPQRQYSCAYHYMCLGYESAATCCQCGKLALWHAVSSIDAVHQKSLNVADCSSAAAACQRSALNRHSCNRHAGPVWG